MSRFRLRVERAWRVTEDLARELGWVELSVMAAAGKLLVEAEGDAEAAMRLVPAKTAPGGAWWDAVLSTLFALWIEEPRTRRPGPTLRVVTS